MEEHEGIDGGAESPPNLNPREQEEVERLRRKIFEADQQLVESNTAYLSEVSFLSSIHPSFGF